MTPDFKLDDDLPPNGTLIQASAGTGKTYSVAALVTQAIAEQPEIRIGNVLVTTYTRNAAAELRARIRNRMLATAQVLRGTPPPGYGVDDLDRRLLAKETERAAKAARLERAVAEFDTATIGTIHSICAAILRMTGVVAAEHGNEDKRREVIAEVVNDAVVAETLAVAGLPDEAEDRPEDQPPRPEWKEESLGELVKKGLGDPHVIAWYPKADRPANHEQALEAAKRVVGECVQRVRHRMRAAPSFDDLLLLARDAVTGNDPRATSFRDSLRKKYKLAIVDEAQDTNLLQWEFLHEIFPPDVPAPAGKAPADPQAANGEAKDYRRLLAVGDPKQAIYGFRGADVTAYLRFAQSGKDAAQDSRHRTLRVNRRSDGPLLGALNAMMSGATFGADIEYEAVLPAKDRESSRMQGLRPVEFIDVGGAPLEDVAVAKVHELLTVAAFKEGVVRPFKPKEVCVLCRTNVVGAAIASRLARLDIPVVTAGTASVMQGQAAADLRALLEAMERPSDAGRARLAAASTFFGRKLTDLTQFTDDELQAIQETIAGWHATLRSKGVAAMVGAISADDAVAKRVAEGRDGQRRIVDLAHIVELLHEETGGRGTSARVLLEHWAVLAKMDPKEDLVSRRVDSDEDAVKVMTVHKAKGLQFPAVVVVDPWKPKEVGGQRGPAVFYEDRERRMDVGVALNGIGTAERSKQKAVAAESEERCRLIYVAVTRPKHHVSILRTVDWEKFLLKQVMPHAPASSEAIAEHDRENLAVRQATELPEANKWRSPEATSSGVFSTASLPPKVEQTYRRMSFSTIKDAANQEKPDLYSAEGHGNDEDGSSPIVTPAESGKPLESDDPAEQSALAVKPAGIEAFTMADLPGGKAFGTLVHDVFEHLDVDPGTSAEQISEKVRALVSRVATSPSLRTRQDAIVELVINALQTPFGGPSTAPFRTLRFLDFARKDRLAELDFEMGVVGIAGGVLASDVGRLLRQEEFLPPPWLRSYAESLESNAFDVPLAGLINGQIDAVLRIPDRPKDDPLLVIADYKTNTLHRADDAKPLAAYAPHRLATAMADAHYPLQALIYGVAAWRMLRARLGPRKPAGWDPGEHIAGIVYAFLRGMKGEHTPVDATGHRYGVFVWQPPSGMWRRLSDLLAGDLTGVRK